MQTEGIEIESIIVGKGHREKNVFLGYKVFEIDEVVNKEQIGIILGVSENKQREIFEDLINYGFEKKIYIFKKYFISIIRLGITQVY